MLRQATRSLRVPTLSPLRRNFFTIVNQGFEAYRLTLGQNPTKLSPGIRWRIPLLHQVQKVDMREIGLNLPEMTAYTKDNVGVRLSVTIFYQVDDIYKACFGVSDYIHAIMNVGNSTIRSIVGTLEYDSIISDRNKINGLLSSVIGTSIDQWGISCKKAEVQNFGPLNSGIEKQLEKQLEAERSRRQTLLDTQAKVNVSDGERQSMVLISQGELASAQNKASAHLVLEQKKAEAKKYTVDQETLALTNQVEQMTKSLGSGELAVKYLLTQRRFAELQAIAKGPNNSVYFVNSDREGIDSMKIFTDLMHKPSNFS